MAFISEEDQRAKMEFIHAFFDDFDKKAAYLIDLYKAGHRDEARILCSSYIDGLACAMCWPDERNNYNYVKALKEYGGNEIFSYIHPEMFDEALNRLSKRANKWKKIHESVSDKLMAAEERLYEESEIVEMLAPLLNAPDMQLIRRELWRGTFAAIVYNRFRIAAAHGFGPPDGTTFNGTTFQGKPIPRIDFFMVHDCLEKILAVARAISADSGKWFGHD